MKIFEVVCPAPGRSSSMALFERTTRKGNGNSDKLNKAMGAAKSNSNLSVRDKLYLATRRLEVTEPPPPGLNVNENFIKELFTLHIKSVDAIRDLQKKLEESNLMLALERLKCQEKDQRIQEQNNNTTQLETGLEQEKEAHDRTKLNLQKYVHLVQQYRKKEALKEHQEAQSQPRQKQQALTKYYQPLKSTPSTTGSENSKVSDASSHSSKKSKGTSSSTKPKTYRRHRNSRGPPLLSPAITPDTPFRNSKPGKVLERAIDKDIQSGDNCDEDDELPSDVEADSVKTSYPKKYGAVEANSSTNLYNSYLNNKAPTTSTAVLSALGKNYSYDPKVIGDISNEIHKTILNETLENENAKERARRTRRTNSGRRSRSSSSEGKVKTRRIRKSRGKIEKTPKSKECLFDSGNTKQLLQRLDKLCQNRTVKTRNDVNENGNEPSESVVSNNSNHTNNKQSTTVVPNSQSVNIVADKSNSTNQSRSRLRRKKSESEDKCNENMSTPKPANSSQPVRTITTRNSVARNLNSSFTPTSLSNTFKDSATARTPQKSNSDAGSKSVPEVSKATVEKISLPVSSPNLRQPTSSESSGLSNNNSPSIASAVAAVSKINLPLSSTSAAIPKANSPGTSASAGLSKAEPTPASNVAAVPKMTENTSVTISNLSSNLLTKGVLKTEEIIIDEKNPSKEMSPLVMIAKTPLSLNSISANITQTTAASTGATPKNIVSNTNTAKPVLANPDKIPSRPSNSYIEKICHGYTRNMNPLLKNNGTATKNSPSAIVESLIAASTSYKGADINAQTKKAIIYANLQEGKTRKTYEKSSKCESYVPLHYSNDVSLNQRENCMTTLVPYFVLDGPPLVSRKKKEKRFATPKTTEGFVEVPSWRIMEFQPIIETDTDVEDFDDTVYLKRHSKPEVDEKRRKRWDSQRMREETYLERLKRRMVQREKLPPNSAKRIKTSKGTSISESVEESDEDMDSFQPCIEDIRFIRVEDDIPIGTFGYPMPIVQKGCFDLPWSPTAVSASCTNSYSCKSPVYSTSFSPRRNGTVNGFSTASVSICNNIVQPSSATSILPNSISNCNQAGSSVNVNGSSSSCKEVSVSTTGPGASTRQSSKRL